MSENLSGFFPIQNQNPIKPSQLKSWRDGFSSVRYVDILIDPYYNMEDIMPIYELVMTNKTDKKIKTF